MVVRSLHPIDPNRKTLLGDPGQAGTALLGLLLETGSSRAALPEEIRH
jgi:hypothetical protein